MTLDKRQDLRDELGYIPPPNRKLPPVPGSNYNTCDRIKRGRSGISAPWLPSFFKYFFKKLFPSKSVWPVYFGVQQNQKNKIKDTFRTRFDLSVPSWFGWFGSIITCGPCILFCPTAAAAIFVVAVVVALVNPRHPRPPTQPTHPHTHAIKKRPKLDVPHVGPAPARLRRAVRPSASAAAAHDERHARRRGKPVGRQPLHRYVHHPAPTIASSTIILFQFCACVCLHDLP